MSEELEYRCFIGNLSWSLSDRDLKDEFDKFGKILEAKVVTDKFTGRSRGFGFVSFGEKRAMEDAIKSMNGINIDGRAITVDKAQSNPGAGRENDRDRDYGSTRGSNGGECYKCGKPGHFARECHGEGARYDRYGSRDDRFGGGRDDRYNSRDDRYGGRREERYNGREDRFGGGREERYNVRDDRYGQEDRFGGGSRYGPSRTGDRFGGRDRFTRDRFGPYDR